MKHEMLNEIVEEIEAEFNQLAEYLFGLAKAPSLEDIEVSFRQSMQRVGGKFIECYVKSRSFGYQGRRIACSCGAMAGSVGYRPKQVQSIIGKATIERAHYYCRSCRSGFAPIREKLGPEYNPEGIICSRLDGCLHKPKSFAGSVRDTLRRAGCNLTFHDLRHSHATVLAYMGVSFKEIQERLGHTLLSTTMNIYLHAAPNMQKLAIQQFDEHLRKAASNGQTEAP